MSAPFAYARSVADVGTIDSHLAIVPAGIADRSALFERLRRTLRLPSYFGANWDALDDCLRDLSWIHEHRVVLFHEGLPALGDDVLRVYLEVLCDAVLDWREDEDDELIVAFTPESRERIEALLGDDG